jgi:hypothetical protein
MLMPGEREGNNEEKRKRNPLYAGTTKSMFNEIESVVSFVLTQESLRIESHKDNVI